MEDAENTDTADSKPPWSTAFAITGYQKSTKRHSRPYRPSNKARRGLDPIYEDVYHYSEAESCVPTLGCIFIENSVDNNNHVDGNYLSVQGSGHSNNPDTGRQCEHKHGIQNGLPNPTFKHDYEEVDEIECGRFVASKTRSHSMFAPRRQSPASQMMNEFMTSRMKTRRNTEPTNQVLQTADWTLGTGLKADEGDVLDLKRDKSSIYHKGNLYVHSSGSSRRDDRRRWTKLEAEPPQDGYLCCPAERKLEKRGFLVLFVVIVLLVFIVIAYMIDRWVIVKVGGAQTELEWRNGNDTALIV